MHRRSRPRPGDVCLSSLSCDLLLTSPLAGANLMGSDLYNNLIRYFVQHLRQLRDVSDGLGMMGRCVTPFSEFRLAAERAAPEVLRRRMGPIHNWRELHQSSLHISEPALGEERAR